MIVSCESCGARYKLDQQKISGRGARITCPRCRHVFVVYREGEADEGSPAPDPAPSVAGSGIPGLPTPAVSLQLDGPAPGPPPAPPPGPVDVHTLDFRKVGVATWKVKVKIGLVYDFSDFRTLSRYISEGRVTAADRISHDGKEWLEIGKIPSLEQHFIDTWTRLQAAQLAAEAAAAAAEGDQEEFQDDEPTNIMGMSSSGKAPALPLASFQAGPGPRVLPQASDPDLDAAAAAALAAEDGDGAAAMRTGNAEGDAGRRFVDPFDEKRRIKEKSGGAGRPRPTSGGAPSRGPAPAPAPRAAPKKPDAKGAPGGIPFIAVVAAIAGVAALIWFFTRPGAPVPAAADPAPAQVGPAAPPPDADRDRERLQEDILRELEPVDEPRTDPVGDEAFEIEDDRELIPLKPGDPRPKPAPKPAADGGAGADAGGAKGHADQGDRAARSGDWAGAAVAYQLAVGIEPRNATYNGKLGIARARSGDAAGAMGPLNIAAQGGFAVALRELGDLSAAQGDAAGAIGYYRRYLDTTPRDAAEVQKKIDALSGG
jgi:predicted Zn finger-like uncharacterized protein